MQELILYFKVRSKNGLRNFSINQSSQLTQFKIYIS